MNNFQLYRTNPRLGGQLKWDILVNSQAASLYVADFHLSPISRNIPYTSKSNDRLVFNRHEDNVKAFYSANRGLFYSESLDSEFNHTWPLIANDEPTTLYSNIYDMGCRRSDKYKVYGKQFEFLCPIWIEHLSDPISFKISVTSPGANTEFASNALTLALSDNAYHNAFVNYFNAYAAAAGLTTGCDDVLNIGFNESIASVTGLNVSNGLFETRSLADLVDNITSLERPLLEVDHMLTNAFESNALICKQLFNFNLCFNIEDIITNGLASMIAGEDMLISVDVYVGDKLIDKVDFNTEYEYIPKSVKSNTMPNHNYTDNVLNYLHDYECVDLIDKNKFCQSTCHWSLCDMPNYIFNVYDGFSGIFIERNVDSPLGYDLYENQHQYGDTPNTIIKKADRNQNSTGWINTININTWTDFYKYIQNTENYKKHGMLLNDGKYLNGIKYKFNAFADCSPTYMIGMIVKSEKLLSKITNSVDCTALYGHEVYLIFINNMIMILTSNVDNLAYGKFFDILYNLSCTRFDGVPEQIYNILSGLYSMMQSKVDPSLVVFGGSIRYTAANGPSTGIAEVEYYKDPNTNNYVLRYDGKIKPAFTGTRNTIYYKDCISHNTNFNNTAYSLYSGSGYEPKYPSVDYCAIKKLNDWVYDNVPTVITTAHQMPQPIYSNTYEYAWFNASKGIVLTPVIREDVINTKQEDGSYLSAEAIAIELVRNYYGVDDPDRLRYLMSLYEISNNWEYFSVTNVDDYIYHITLRLK